MAAAHQTLLNRLDRVAPEFGELREGVQAALRIADTDAVSALIRIRKVLLFVIEEIYKRRTGKPPGTQPLENLQERLVKDSHFPNRLDAFATAIRKLGNVAAHRFGKSDGEKITAADVNQALEQLHEILDWYFKSERPDALDQSTPAPTAMESTASPAALATEPVSRSEPSSALALASQTANGHSTLVTKAQALVPAHAPVIVERAIAPVDKPVPVATTPRSPRLNVGCTVAISICLLMGVFAFGAWEEIKSWVNSHILSPDGPGGEPKDEDKQGVTPKEQTSGGKAVVPSPAVVHPEDKIERRPVAGGSDSQDRDESRPIAPLPRIKNAIVTPPFSSENPAPVVVAPSPKPVNQPDSSEPRIVSRDELLNAFDDLRTQSKLAYSDRDFTKLHIRDQGSVRAVSLYEGSSGPRLKGVKVANANQQLMFKIWAAPIVDGRESRTYVNLSKYSWKRGEEFALYLETSAPVQFAVYQEIANNQKKTVLPDPKFPDSYQTVRSGSQPYRFPIEFQLGDDDDDELVSFCVVVAGSEKDIPPKDSDNVGSENKPAMKHAIFSKVYTDALSAKADEAKRSARLKTTLQRDKTDPNIETKSTDPDKVATICYSSELSGNLEVVFKKK